jgi:hypothetical protein
MGFKYSLFGDLAAECKVTLSCEEAMLRAAGVDPLTVAEGSVRVEGAGLRYRLRDGREWSDFNPLVLGPRPR